ncbi:MAG: threonine synthase [Rhodothermales bacterium]|nr:threonine synthase [Rhodothermales bacterium]
MPDPVHYKGTVNGERSTFADAILNGAPPGGGLYVPETIPEVELVPTADFVDLATRLLEPWIGNSLSHEDQKAISASAFTFDVPILRLPPDSPFDSLVIELSHGPTGSFKDFGARWLARALSTLLEKIEGQRRVIVATSGDTGSAVADAFAGLDKVDVVLLFPANGVSDMQRRQLTARREGVTVFEVDGDFDDCQALVKRALMMTNLPVPTTSANSINVGRLLPQMSYYAYAAMQMDPQPVFVVPSGNLGNLAAGILANRALNLNARFVAAHNANESMVRFLRGDEVNQATIQTISNAMDVGSPSNLDRILRLMSLEEARDTIKAVSLTDTETIEVMRQSFRTTGYVCDPHTAIGLGALSRFTNTGNTAVLSTAHPAKFPELVKLATGSIVPVPESLEGSLVGDASCRHCGSTGEEFFDFVSNVDLTSNT